ncbi:hypothetical protein FQR65_LT01654 [Abscondita terminalis]|nr:hypothetical protein FQR65_LT01654 [Abscondita terminalis]
MDENLGFGMRCVKFILIFLNFIFLIVGIFTVAAGVIVLIAYDNFELFLESYHLKPAQFIISVGTLTVFICFVGFLGAYKESTLIVNTFALLLFLLLLLEIGITIAVLIFRCYESDTIKDQMNEKLAYYKTDDTIRETWDASQEILRCCGVDYDSDWAPYYVNGHQVSGKNYTVPYSCCKNSSCNQIFVDGCFKLINHYISQSTSMFLYFCLGNVIIKIFAILLARILAKAIRRIKSTREMERYYTSNIVGQ